MKRQDAIDYIGGYIDDALSDHAQPVTPRTRLVGWQCGFEPMFVAVNSYLPDCRCDDDEAIELAMDYLTEKGWFDGEAKEPDCVL